MYKPCGRLADVARGDFHPLLDLEISSAIVECLLSDVIGLLIFPRVPVVTLVRGFVLGSQSRRAGHARWSPNESLKAHHNDCRPHAHRFDGKFNSDSRSVKIPFSLGLSAMSRVDNAIENIRKRIAVLYSRGKRQTDLHSWVHLRAEMELGIWYRKWYSNSLPSTIIEERENGLIPSVCVA